MTTTVSFLGALAVSVAAIAYLLIIDEKRSRVFRIQRATALPRSKAAGWIAAVAPGIALIAAGQLSAFLAWFGAVTVCAWMIVSRPPKARADD